jgi:oxygen-independent coproporphyrinogen-3 oxidase
MEQNYDKYVQALILEIKSKACEYKDFEIKTVFIGGGTPTVLPSDYIVKIIETLYENYTIATDAEISIEANPGTIDLDKLTALRKSGINRISMGVQAWQDRLLKKLGRIHSQEQFLEGYSQARQAGFDNINLDLMFTLPTQSVEDWEQTLENVIKLKPEHISTYSLIIEETTPFYELYGKKELELPDEMTDRTMYYKAKELLKQNGYVHYEISNFAKPGFESKHNIVYWRQKQYIGFGLGAHSYINKTRFHNTYDMGKYLTLCDCIEDIEKSDLYDEYAEYMFLGLRLIKGVSISDFKLKFSKDIDTVYGEELEACKKLGLLYESNDYIALTDYGLDVSNIVFEKFLKK